MEEVSEEAISEQQEPLDPGTLPESVPDFLRAPTEQLGVIDTELVLDTRLVTGEIRYTGVTRRLVDILNALEGGYLTMHAGTLRNAVGRSLEFDVIQIARSSILLCPTTGAWRTASWRGSSRSPSARSRYPRMIKSAPKRWHRSISS